MPADARSDSQGVRWYRWEAEGEEPTDVLSVTSVRRMCGVSYNLVKWQIANIVNSATGTRSVERVGPRGGVKRGYEPDGEFPGQFITQMLATEGDVGKIEAVRKWLTQAAEEPRDSAAIRGTVVHSALETGELDPDRDWVVAQYERESRDRRRGRIAIPTDDDVMFITRSVAQYNDFRKMVPMTILAHEAQLWNLTLGYAGSADAIARLDTSGELVVLDWKTAAGLYTDNLLQVTAYMAAEFSGAGGVRDEAVTALLPRVTKGGLVHIRPDGWSLHLFPFRREIMQAFVGSVMLARFTADWPEPEHLFSETKAGRAATA